jgi:predicted O-methyltransferase YrrM
MVAHQGLTQRQFHELFTTKECESLNLLPTIKHFTLWDANYAKDVFYLALLAKTLSPQTIFEIGTLYGDSALLFALNTPAESRIYTLDLPPDSSSSPTLATTLVDDKHVLAHARTTRYLYQSHCCGGKVTQLYGDSASFNYDAYKGQVDLFFIDGAHSYAYVRSDTQKALACVRKGGVIAWHDYGRWGVNGVSKWLHQLVREGKEIYRLPGSSLAILKV